MQRPFGIRTIVSLTVLGALAACSGSSATLPGQKSCDPLAAVEKPVTLGALVGAGKDASAVVYVADQAGGTGATDRVFVSDGNTLVRKRVTGSGSSSDASGETHTYSFEDGGGTHSLVIVTANGKVTGMTEFDADVGKGPGAGAPAGNSLTVLGASDVSTMKLRNLPGEVLIEYLADVEGKGTLVVTRPKDDWTYTDFRLFYGSQSRTVDEKPVTSVTRAKDGGSTTIVFTLDSAEATARFPVAFVNQAFQPGPATLETAGKTLALTLHTPAPTSVPGVTFSCLP